MWSRVLMERFRLSYTSKSLVKLWKSAVKCFMCMCFYIDGILKRFVAARVANSKQNVGGDTRRDCKIASGFTAKRWSCASSDLKCKRYVCIHYLTYQLYVRVNLHTFTRPMLSYLHGVVHDEIIRSKCARSFDLAINFTSTASLVVWNYYLFHSTSSWELCKTVLSFYRRRSKEGA